MLDKFILKKGKKLRYGYTTGSCAAGAAKAAAFMLFNNIVIEKISIETPKGWLLDLKINDIQVSEDKVTCSIIKDAGDDPDITDGIKIYATAEKKDGKDIEVIGGEGIGTVTRKGLLLDVGKPAINPVPMNMIMEEVNKVKPANKGIIIEISAPEGIAIAEKTFNPQLGIMGGISILGTSGIVEPMSEESMKESLALEISLLKEHGSDTIAFVPGNYGKKFAMNNLHISYEKIAVTSNFIGYMLEQAAYYGIKNILLIGHAGKLIKIAGGIFNTHSRISDARLEILASHYAYFNSDINSIKNIMDCPTVEEALEYINHKDFFDYMAERICSKCIDYVHNALTVEAVIFSMHKGVLGMSKGSHQIIKELMEHHNE